MIIFYIPAQGDLCARCNCKDASIVARNNHPNGWIINICANCLTTEESLSLLDTIYDRRKSDDSKNFTKGFDNHANLKTKEERR